MSSRGLSSNELARLGVPSGEATKLAGLGIQAALGAGRALEEIQLAIRSVVKDPEAHRGDPHFAGLAAALAAERARFIPRDAPAPYRRWGGNLDADSLRQMANACKLPVSVRGAL